MTIEEYKKVKAFLGKALDEIKAREEEYRSLKEAEAEGIARTFYEAKANGVREAWGILHTYACVEIWKELMR